MRSPRRPVPFDWTGQVAAVVALGALTFAAIETGADGFGAPKVLVAFTVAVVAAAAFVAAQVRGKHPMVPMDLLRSSTMRIASANGFAFIAGLNGTVFLYSLYLQQDRGLSALAVRVVFLPMAALSNFLGVPTARLTKRDARACPSCRLPPDGREPGRTGRSPGLRASLSTAAVIVIATATANILPERRGALNH